jgi:hypothetical protein
MLKPRSLYANLMFKTGLWRSWRSGALVIFYHSVTDQAPDPLPDSDSVPFFVFRQHLDFFQKHRVVIPLSQLLDDVTGARPPDPRSVSICFDDGLASLLRQAIDELASRKFQFTVGVPTALPDTGRSLWELETTFLACKAVLGGRSTRLPKLALGLRPALTNSKPLLDLQDACAASSISKNNRHRIAGVATALKRLLRSVGCCERIKLLDDLVTGTDPSIFDEMKENPRFSVMTWDELGSVCTNGGSLAAHGHFHHPHNDSMDESCRLNELQLPLAAIKERTGCATDCFIWPEGAISADSVKVGTDLGYKYFLSTRAGLVGCDTPATDIPRINGQWPLPQLIWHSARV